jgi:hypothetical protein
MMGWEIEHAAASVEGAVIGCRNSYHEKLRSVCAIHRWQYSTLTRGSKRMGQTLSKNCTPGSSLPIMNLLQSAVP